MEPIWAEIAADHKLRWVIRLFADTVNFRRRCWASWTTSCTALWACRTRSRCCTSLLFRRTATFAVLTSSLVVPVEWIGFKILQCSIRIQPTSTIMKRTYRQNTELPLTQTPLLKPVLTGFAAELDAVLFRLLLLFVAGWLFWAVACEAFGGDRVVPLAPAEVALLAPFWLLTLIWVKYSTEQAKAC